MRSILITGGTGYFGRAFIKRIINDPKYQRIVVLSRNEHQQAAMANYFNERPEIYKEWKLRFFIGDVRDKDRLVRAMDGCDIVVHAAALKRIEVGHYNPDEMVKTNVLGTMNVIEAALDAHGHSVAKVVGISSDKAWQPISAYGQSKALAETLLMSANNRTHHDRIRFSTVRYGNVAGSSGSVIPKWMDMISKGHHVVPVSDPDCTRFWMTIEQACTLVEEAIDLMPSHGPLIPKLPAYRLGDLASAFGVHMQVKGLPAWEKKHEGMDDGNTSDKAQRMTVQDLKAGIECLSH